MESVESEKEETREDVFCSCKRSRCLSYLCKCYSDRLYCGDGCRCHNCNNKPDSGGNSASSSSTGNKKGCKCQKIKCQNTSCRCYKDDVGCTMRCRCQDCANVFGMKPERGAEYWKNRTRADSTKFRIPNQLSPTQEKHITGSEKGTNLSPEQPCPSKEVLDESLYDIGETMGDDLNRLFSIDHGMIGHEMIGHEMIGHEMIGHEMDDIPETKEGALKRSFSLEDILELFEGDDIIMEDSNPTNTKKSESPGEPTAASTPCSPTPTTCCNTEDGTSQTEIHHEGGNHDK